MIPIHKLQILRPRLQRAVLPLVCALTLLVNRSSADTYVSAGGSVQSWLLDWDKYTTHPREGWQMDMPCFIPKWSYAEATAPPAWLLGAPTAYALGQIFDGGFRARADLRRGMIDIRAGGPNSYGAYDSCNDIWVYRDGSLSVEASYEDVITLYGDLDYVNPVPVKVRGKWVGDVSGAGAVLMGSMKVLAAPPTTEVTLFDINQSDLFLTGLSSFGFDYDDFEYQFLVFPRTFRTEPYQFAISAHASGSYPGQSFAGLHLHAYISEIVLPPGVGYFSESEHFLDGTAEIGEFIKPEITWAKPLPILSGTPLSPAQLNATADLPGTFEYDPPFGTVLEPGYNHLLKVHFTPDLASVFPSVDAYVLLDVMAAAPAVIAGPIQNPENSRTYYLLDQSDWRTAEAAAQAMGGHLATIRNQAEQDFIYSTFGNYGGVSRHLMTGLYDSDPVNNATDPVARRSEFVWASGQPVVYSNWLDNEPNNFDGQEMWGQMFAGSFFGAQGESVTSIGGFWNDVGPADGWGGAPLNGVVEITLSGPLVPALRSISPTGASFGAQGVTLFLYGENFTPDAVVYWNGSPRQTTYIGSSELRAHIGAADLSVNAVDTIMIQVGAPGGPLSNSRAFAIMPALVKMVESTVLEPISTGVASALSDSGTSGVEVLARNNTGSAPMTVLAALYDGVPTATGPFQIEGGTFVDVQILGADSGDDAGLLIYYSTDGNEEDLALKYFDGTQFIPVLSSGGGIPNKNTTDNLHGTVSDGLFTVVLDNTSTPKITELTGTIFAILNPAPQISAVAGPEAPLPLGKAALLSASYTTLDPAQGAQVTFFWGDGSSSTVAGQNGGAESSHTYGLPGVYTVTVRVTDVDGVSATRSFEYVVVYDASAGFVTGGGWIQSPPNSYTSDPGLTGTATFGFVAKYKKGASIPDGRTEFQFKLANLNFQSTSYDWLVVAGAKAQYKGSGRIEGQSAEFAFLLTATDGQVSGGGGSDKLRMKIWNKATGVIVYDNAKGASDEISSANPQAISGGSIVIHKGT